MLIYHPKAFWRGIILLASFAFIFVLILSPIFPSEMHDQKTNGLVFADHMFNTLSKGSANFFDRDLKNSKSVNVAIQRVKDTQFSLQFNLPNTEAAQNALNLLGQVGITAALAENGAIQAANGNGDSQQVKGVPITVTNASLFTLLSAMVEDAEYLYHNDDQTLSSKYGMDGRLVVRTWWQIASSMIKPMQRADLISEASVVHTVQTKGLETSYNFFGITAVKVSDNVLLVVAFLLFYVVYTMWYGFGIFEIFDGVGLSMNKGHKQET